MGSRGWDHGGGIMGDEILGVRSRGWDHRDGIIGMG